VIGSIARSAKGCDRAASAQARCHGRGGVGESDIFVRSVTPKAGGVKTQRPHHRQLNHPQASALQRLPSSHPGRRERIQGGPAAGSVLPSARCRSNEITGRIGNPTGKAGFLNQRLLSSPSTFRKPDCGPDGPKNSGQNRRKGSGTTRDLRGKAVRLPGSTPFANLWLGPQDVEKTLKVKICWHAQTQGPNEIQPHTTQLARPAS